MCYFSVLFLSKAAASLDTGYVKGMKLGNVDDRSHHLATSNEYNDRAYLLSDDQVLILIVLYFTKSILAIFWWYILNDSMMIHKDCPGNVHIYIRRVRNVY